MDEDYKKKVKIATIFAIVANVIYGVGYSFAIISYRVATPAVSLFYRFVTAFIVLNIWYIIGKGKISLKGKNIKGLIIFVLIEPVSFLVESYGIYYTNATFSSLISSVAPIFAIIMSCLLLKEYPTKLQAIFCILPIVGVIIITINGNSLGVIKPIGVILLLVYTVLSAAYKTVNRGISNDFTPFERSYFLIGTCALFYVFYSLIYTKGDISLYIEPLKHTEFITSTLVLTLVNSIVCVAITNYSAKYISVTKMANFASITVLTATFTGVVALNEPINLTILLGMALIIFGVYMVSTKGD